MLIDTSRPILAVDTGTSFLSLALRADGEVRLYHENVGTRQSELILPQIRVLFEQAGIGASDLGGIVYAQGPGAFTGLRIGAGVVQGLATPFDTPVIGVPSLDAAAYLVPDCPCVLAATDARMGDYHVGKASEIVLPQGQTFGAGVGNAFALADKPPFDGIPSMPTAAYFLELALSGRYPAADAAHAELLYVRDKIALTAKEQAQRKAKP